MKTGKFWIYTHLVIFQNLQYENKNMSTISLTKTYEILVFI